MISAPSHRLLLNGSSRIVFYIAFFFFAPGIRCAFAALPADSIKIINDKKYRIHVVVKGETVYSIAKKYQADVKEVILANPPAIKSLKEGQDILIPVWQEPLPQGASKREGNLIMHTVAAGQTLYSIAKKYSVTIEKVREFNPELDAGLKAGMVLKIPVAETGDIPEIFLPEPDTAAIRTPVKKLKDTYDAAIILPLFLDANDTIRAIPPSPPAIFSRSLPALSFYEGALLAIDSLNKSGMKVNIHVYDSGNDTNQVIKLQKEQDSSLSAMDVIIGPFYSKEFEMMAGYSLRKKIKTVTPMLQRNDVLLGKPNIFKMKPSVAAQLDCIAGFIARTYPSKQILILYNANQTEQKRAEGFKAFFDKHFRKIKDARAFSPPEKENNTFLSTNSAPLIKELAVRDIASVNIPPSLSVSDTTIVVIPSTDQIFVSEIMPLLNDLVKNYSMIVAGLSDWEHYENMETDYLRNLQVILSSANSNDVNDTLYKSFINRFYNRYKTFPGEFAVSGFDITFIFLNAIRQYGTDFQNFIFNTSLPGIYSTYRFVQLGEGNGYENQYVCIKKFEDYRLIKIYPAE